MDEEIEHNQFSRTTKVIFGVGHDGQPLIKWMAYFDWRSGKRNYTGLMAFVLSALKT